MTQAALLRYLSSGTHAGISNLYGVAAWTDGSWMWDEDDIDLVRTSDCVPWDEQFTRRVLASATTLSRSADEAAGVALGIY